MVAAGGVPVGPADFEAAEIAAFKTLARRLGGMSEEHGDGSGGDDHHPDRERFEHDPIGHAEARAGMTVGELADEYGNAGVGAASLHEAVSVTEAMFADDVTVFFGLAGAMVPTGMRRIVADLIRDGYVDALITTGANLTHDSIEAIGGKHHHGCVHAEGETEREHDETLRDEGVDRIYNVYLPQEFFATFESHLREEVFPVLEAEAEDSEAPRASEDSSGASRENGPVSIERLTRELGRANAEINERDDVEEGAGIAAAAYENDVPIYCPAIQDSVLGLQAWMYSQTSSFTLDALADMTALTDLAFEAEKAGAFVVGGGVPKNFTLQTMLVTPGAYDYAVQLTMDPKQTGGLSGATLDEARSWGKLEKDAENVSVYADATITLPLVVAAARERLE
jgi:deoxyhypusine synthase